MALPTLTTEQRNEALKKAAASRKARAELKAELKSGSTDLKQVFDRSDDPVVGKMRVVELLSSLPRIGKVKAEEAMADLAIAPTRRVTGLGKNQREALLDRFA